MLSASFGAIFLLLVAVLLSDAFFVVPKFHYGVHERLGKRTGIIYFEGWGLKVPFLDKVEIISLELAEIEVIAVFTTGRKMAKIAQAGKAAQADDDGEEDDKIEVKMKGSLQYRPNPFVVDDYGLNVFITMSEKIIKGGVEDVLSDMLGGLGGIHQAEDFIENRQAFGDLTNQILKMGTPYHLDHAVSGACGIEKCEFKQKVPREKLVDFYNAHWEQLKIAIATRNESRRNAAANLVRSPIPWIGYAGSFKAVPGSRPIDPINVSPTEQRYGIDVETFAIANIDFSDAVKKAFEKKREAKERRKAFDIKLEMAERAKAGLEIDGQVALNSADVSLTPEIAGNKSVISVEGEAGVLGAFANAVARRKS